MAHHAYSGFMFPARTTSAQRAISRAMSWPKACGVEGSGDAPSMASCCATSGRARALLTSAFRRATAAAGVPAGALDVRQFRRCAGEGAIDLARDHVGNRRRRATIRDVQHENLRPEL